MSHEEASMRERLILAGIQEIEARGIQNFSMRQVANACGVSCAAPYKHFQDKNDLILSIVLYIQQQWHKNSRPSCANTREILGGS